MLPNLSLRKSNIFILWLAEFCLMVAQFSPAFGDDERSQSSGRIDSDSSEIDRWRGSLLGINLEIRRRDILVSMVEPPAAEEGVFVVGDVIRRIGDVDIDNRSLDALRSLLRGTPPGTRLPVVLERNGETLEADATTFRPELIDAGAIANYIQRNPIIREHITSRGNPSLLLEMKSRLAESVNGADSPRLAQEGVNKMIDELDLSHTAYVPACSYAQLTSESNGDCGVTLRRFSIDGKTGYFVIDLKPGTIAFESGIRIGDQVECINGVPIEQSRRLVLVGEEQRYEVFGCKAEVGETIQFQHRHLENADPETTSLQVEDSPSLEAITDASVRIVESSGCKVGYIRLWNLMSEQVAKSFAHHVRAEFASCHALVVDLRGRGGQVTVAIEIEQMIRAMKVPVVVITDELTRSAKEILAHRLKHIGHVLVLGERTSGAVTAATFITLPSGNTLMLPIQSSDSLKTYVDGKILEGAGVEPDEQVGFFEPFCNGRDHLFNAAIKRAPERIIN
jgi:carboxyl-terminal processing protease